MIKLIVSDVDGTLVPDGSAHVNPELFQVILKLREKGIQFAIATGRQRASLEAAFEPVKKKIFYIANNGAYLGCYERPLFIYPIERELVRQLLEAVGRNPELSAMYAGPDGDFIQEGNPELYQWLKDSYKFKVDQVQDLSSLEIPCTKISIYKKGNVEEAAGYIRDEFQGRLQIALAGDQWLDCMALNVNKGQAVKTLQESLGILREETMVFGDQFNDLEMMDQAYYSFAVANARPQVRQAARFQADSNEHNGVLKVLKQLL